MANFKKLVKRKAKSGAKKKTKPATDSGVAEHRGRFNQLLDDAVLGVKKK